MYSRRELSGKRVIEIPKHDLDVVAPAVTNYAGRLGERAARLDDPLRARLARCNEPSS